MMSPKVEARMLQALAAHPGDTVLEIGTGSGFVTALLAESGDHVTSLDIHADFTESANAKLTEYGITNTTLISGDGVDGWEQAAPYDVIAVTGSVPKWTEQFQRQLKVGGRLFVIVGESPVMEARLITRVDDNDWAEESLFETDLPALVGAPRPDSFVF
jgi:protein-L-isoaspartate(D-aspartate) O-methyltransferase